MKPPFFKVTTSGRPNVSISLLGWFFGIALVTAVCTAVGQTSPPQIWSFLASGAADKIVPAATPDGGVVIVVPERLNQMLVRVAPPRVQKISSTGQLAWQHDLTWDGIGWPVVLNDGAVLVAEGSPQFGVGRLRCVEPDGTIRWSMDDLGSPLIAPCIRPSGRIMMVTTPGDLLCISPPGQIEHRTPLADAACRSAVSLADGQFLLVTINAVHSLTEQGESIWSTAFQPGEPNPPAVANDGTIVGTTAHGWLLLINPDGSYRYSEWVGVGMSAPVVAKDGTIYIPRSDKKLDVRDLTGALVRQIQLPDSPGMGAALAEDGRLWLTFRGGQLVGLGPTGDTVSTWSGPGSSGGAMLLMSGGGLVVGYDSRDVISFGEAGEPASPAWPLLACNPSRTGMQPQIPLPTAPQGVTATGTNYSVRISCEPIGEVVTYEVWRGVSPDFAKATRCAAFLQRCEWTDEMIVSGHDYWYWVRARNAAGFGPVSEPVRFRRDVPAVGGVAAALKLSDGPLSVPAQGADGTIYVSDSHGVLFALDQDGTEKWRLETQTPGMMAPPVVAADGHTYVATADGLLGISPNGTIEWRQPGTPPAKNLPAAPAFDSKGNLVYTANLGLLPGLVVVTPAGEILHQVELANISIPYLDAPVVGGDDTIWLAGQSGVVRRAHDGTFLWSAAAICAGAFRPAALDVGGEIVVGGTNTYSGLTRCASDGSIVWKVGTNDVVSGAVLDSDGTAYFGDTAGWFHAVTRAGEMRWSVELGAPISCTPALGEPDYVYVADDTGRVVGLDRASGAERWRVELGSQPIGALVVMDQSQLALSTTNGTLYLIRTTGGAPNDAIWPMLGRNAAHHSRLPIPMPALQPPSAVAATESVTNTEVTVTWTPVAGGVWYDVYRAPSNDINAAVPVATNLTVVHTFTDYFVPGNQTHWYWVRAAAPDGPGPWSEPARGLQGSRKWRVSPAGGVPSAPAISDNGIVYVASDLIDKRILVALAASDGRELWRRVLPLSKEPAAGMRSPVLTPDGRVIVSGLNTLACFSAAGDLLWQREGYQCNANGAMALTDSGLLVVPVPDFLTAWNANTGQMLWELAMDKPVSVGPVIARDGTIWVASGSGGSIAIQPNGTRKLQAAANSTAMPTLSRSGHLLVREIKGSSSIVKIVAPDGGVTTLDTRLRPRFAGLSPADNLFTLYNIGTPNEMVTFDTSGSVVSRVPCTGIPSLAYDYVIGGDGTWYAVAEKSIYVVDGSGNLRAVWPLYREAVLGGMVLGDDGTLYVSENGFVSAFPGFAPPPTNSWAMARKDRRRSASWADQMPLPEAPSGFAVNATASVNTASLHWNQPTNLTVLELWRSQTPSFTDATLIARPLITQTNYTDWDRTPGSTSYYWLRALDLAGAEIGLAGPVISTTVQGPALAWRVPVSTTDCRLALAEDGTLYHLTSRALSAYKPDGTVLWTNSSAGGLSHLVGPNGTIIVWKGMYLTAVSSAGEIMWEEKLLQTSSGSAELAVSENGMLVAAGPFGLCAYSLDGQLKWGIWTEAYNSVVMADDETVYATTTQSRLLRCYKPNGELSWTAEPTGVYGVGLALAENGTLLASGRDSRLRWIDSQGTVTTALELAAQPGETVISTGVIVAPIWRSQLAPDSLAIIDPSGALRTTVSLQPYYVTAVANGAFLITCKSNLVALDANGTVRWSYDPQIEAGQLSETILAPDGRIYFAATNALHALNSDLRPDSSAWYTKRGNNRRTGKWSHPAPAKPCFYGASKTADNQLNLWLSLPVGTTNHLELTTDWQLWTTVGEVVGVGGPTNVVVPIQSTETMGVFRLRIVPNP